MRVISYREERRRIALATVPVVALVVVGLALEAVLGLLIRAVGAMVRWTNPGIGA